MVNRKIPGNRITTFLLLLIFSCNSIFGQDTSQTDQHIFKPAQEEDFFEERSLDDWINEKMDPATRFISDIIFYAIPIKSAVTSPVDGVVKRFQSHDKGKMVVIEKRSGELVMVEIPDERKPDININEQVSEGQVLVASVDLPFVLIWLILGACIFTLYFWFPNFKYFKTAINIVRGKYSDPNESGEVSHFQALTAALSGTVGLGNIAGVAIAISVGGPGATFWMIVAGLIGMSSKFVECTLGVKYRNIDEDGVVHGGPMYYLSKGLAKRGMKGFGKVLAVFFAIMCIGGSFGGGNMFQVNQAFSQFSNITAGEFQAGWLFGLIMAILVGIVIIGGIKSIAKVTDKIVPFMVGIYVAAALVIIFGHISHIGSAFAQIFSGAFTQNAMYGGLIGVLIQGFRRAAFSNEAGIGSASIAHAAVRTNHPASEGLVSLLEPFIDTVVVCTMTALVIIITGQYEIGGTDGVQLTSAAFGSVISWFPYILSIAVILFAFSTMLSWSYYGLQSWTYLFGRSKAADYSYKIIFCVFIIIGAAMSLGSVTDFSDAMIFAMCFPNIIGLYILMPEVRTELRNYLKKIGVK